jgi:hypothetical protein
MIALRTALLGLLALLALLAPAAAAAARRKVYQDPMYHLHSKARRFARHAQKHYQEHGVFPKQRGAAERMAAAAASNSSYAYVINYAYTDDSCSADSVVSAVASKTDVCAYSGFFLSMQYKCSKLHFVLP